MSLPNRQIDVVWGDYDDRTFEVHQQRCLACGALESVRQDWFDAHKDDKKIPGLAGPGDGRKFFARPLTEEA